MESESDRRQSGILSIINHEKIEPIHTDRLYTSTSMASAAVISPGSMYSNPPPPYSSGWSGPSMHSISGLISPPDSRRTSDNKNEPPPPIQTSHRQSLPSIHEALNSASKPVPYTSPVSASLLQSHPNPYPQQAGPQLSRPYPPSDHGPYSAHLPPSQSRQSSPPRTAQPPAQSFSRPEQSHNSYSEAQRHPSLTSLQAPSAPPNPYAAPRYDPARYEQESRVQDRAPQGYSHPPPPPQTAYPYASVPGPLTPAGPHGPNFNQPHYPPRDPREVQEPWKGMGEGGKKEPVLDFRHGLKRNLEVWDFENSLAEISTASRLLSEWSSHYNAIAQEQQRSINIIPDRMPTIESVDEMIRNQEKINAGLHKMKSMIYEEAQNSAHQRMRDQGIRGPGEYEDEMAMYGDDRQSLGYSSESKKRRGRAAPPGRCHSCNRAETPEWRRGPDGARTLCNACGLHYAKLTRKNTMKQSQGSNGSSLRPKGMDDMSPRPL